MRTVVTTETRRRWALVLGVVVLLAAVPVVLDRWPARAAAVDPAELRARMAASAAQPYQGYAQSNGLLPLPRVPNFGQITDLVSGRTEMRTWYAGPDRWRVDVLNGGSERDLYRTPQAEFVWDFDDLTLTRIEGDQPVRLPRAADLTPPELARRLLSLAAGDRAEPLAGRRVAGIAASGLRIVPAAAETTVDHVDLWADPATGLPLQAEITAKGGERPVFVTRFLEVRLSTPDPGPLTPPAKAAAVVDAPDLLGALQRQRSGAAPLPAELAGRARQEENVYGTGLARFVVLPVPRRFGNPAYDNLERFGRPVPGGALIGTGLLSVLVARDDRQTYLVAGLVDPAVLERVAAELTS